MTEITAFVIVTRRSIGGEGTLICYLSTNQLFLVIAITANIARVVSFNFCHGNLARTASLLKRIRWAFLTFHRFPQRSSQAIENNGYSASL